MWCSFIPVDSRSARSCWPNHCARSVGPGFFFGTVAILPAHDQLVRLSAWVFAMPGGLALIVSLNEDGEESGALIHTSLDKVVSFWAPRDDPDLVRVTV